MEFQPDWLVLGNAMIGPLLADTSSGLKARYIPDFHLSQLPILALFHLAHSLQSSMDTNYEGRHAVALSLLRHAIESITIVELGLIGTEEANQLLEAWDKGKKSQGNLRKALERIAWPKYGSGIWNEPWSEFFSSLAKAVQPYTHCSSELMQWNMAVLSVEDDYRLVAGAGMYDPVKASRLTLFHVLVVWTLGRILLENSPESFVSLEKEDISRLRGSLAGSEFLVENEDWSIQLWPHMIFKK